jgi:hypothetical protein
LQIYDLFTIVPPLENSHEPFNDHFTAVRTRRNLMLVCHTITQEFTPLFYRTTTFIVHTPKEIHELNPRQFRFDSVTGNYKQKRFGQPGNYCTPAEFGHLFLKRLQPQKICNIRKLVFRTAAWTYYMGGYLLAADPYVEFPARVSLTSMLRSYKSVMTSLSEVLLLGPPCTSWVPYLLPSQPNADPHFDPKEIWKRAAGNWDHTLRLMQSARRSGIFRGWRIEKEVSISVCEFEQAYIIRKTKVTFRKAEGSQDVFFAAKFFPGWISIGCPNEDERIPIETRGTMRSFGLGGLPGRAVVSSSLGHDLGRLES